MNTVRLQGIGLVESAPASSLKTGDVIVYNYGYTAEVKELYEKGKCMYVKLFCNTYKKFYEQRFLKTRHIVINTSKN